MGEFTDKRKSYLCKTYTKIFMSEVLSTRFCTDQILPLTTDLESQVKPTGLNYGQFVSRLRSYFRKIVIRHSSNTYCPTRPETIVIVRTTNE